MHSLVYSSRSRRSMRGGVQVRGLRTTRTNTSIMVCYRPSIERCVLSAPARPITISRLSLTLLISLSPLSLHHHYLSPPLFAVPMDAGRHCLHVVPYRRYILRPISAEHDRRVQLRGRYVRPELGRQAENVTSGHRLRHAHRAARVSALSVSASIIVYDHRAARAITLFLFTPGCIIRNIALL